MDDFDASSSRLSARHPGPHGHCAQPHQRAASVVRGIALVARRGPSDWYVWRMAKRMGSCRTTGSAASVVPVDADEGTVSTTSTTTCRSSRTSTGGTRTCAPRSTTSSASGPTGEWPASALTWPTSSLRTPSSATTAGTEDDDFETQMFGQRSVYNAKPTRGPRGDQALATVGRRLRRARLLIGETPVPVDKLAEFYATGPTSWGWLQFQLHQRPFEAAAMRSIVEETEAALPPGAWPAWTGSNHDMFRFPTRWARMTRPGPTGAPDAAQPARHPVLYQGDEIGMANVAVAHEDMRDRSGCASTRTTRS